MQSRRWRAHFKPIARLRLRALLPPASILVLALAAAAPSSGAPVPVHVRLSLVESPLEQSQLDRCEVAADLEAGRPETWSFFFGEVQLGESGSWEALRARAGCDAGTFDEKLPAKQWSLRGVPYLMVDVSVRRSTKNRAEQLEVTTSRRKLSGFSQIGEPSYERLEETRVFPLEDVVTATVPLLIADENERNAFRAFDVLLRLRASTAGKKPAAYGEVSVQSDTPRADILLDGGVVARTVEGTPTQLKNVLAGERELRVRDFSGREAKKVVQILKDKRIDVVMNLRDPARPAVGDGLTPLGTNPQGYEEYWRPKDGAPVVKVPGGEFLMGSVAGEGEPAEHPQRKVYVSPYLIDKTEVTWGQYEKFSKKTGTPLPEAPLWGTPDDYPVTSVTWPEAAAFCAWAGGRLPTEAEWEKAARGPDGRRYPWGDDWDRNRCNSQDGGPHRPEGAGAFPGCVSPYGLLDCLGGVWEFCGDWFEASYYESGPTRDPRGPASGQLRVIRGGSWLDWSGMSRPAYRQGTEPLWRNTRYGFRCVQSAPE
jgi:formylglycine-generating enzyme required for sulfatase activity